MNRLLSPLRRSAVAGPLALLLLGVLLAAPPAHGAVSGVSERLKSAAIQAGGGAVAAGVGYVDVNTWLNVRSGPSTEHAVIGRLFANDRVEILETRDGWHRIAHQGREGWICGRYVNREQAPGGIEEFDPPKDGFVDVRTYLNVRTGPGTHRSVIDHLSRNEKVEIVGQSNGWYKIKIPGGTAWVSARYVSSKPVSDLPPDPSTPPVDDTPGGDDPPATSNPGILKVPIRTQFDAANVVNGIDYRNSWCGPTSFAMVLDYYGVHKSTYECAKLVKYTFKERVGTPLAGIVEGGRAAGFAGTKSYSGQSLAWLKSQVAAGKPVIVNVDTKWAGHYIVVCGFDGDNVVVNDPGKGSTSRVRYTMSRESFWQCWSSKNRNCVVVER